MTALNEDQVLAYIGQVYGIVLSDNDYKFMLTLTPCWFHSKYDYSTFCCGT